MGIPLAFALAAVLFFYLIPRSRLSSSGDFRNKAEEIDFSVASRSVAEVSGHREYELPVGIDVLAELDVKPV